MLVSLLLVWVTPSQAQWDNPTPQVLLYADMENAADVTPIGTLPQQRVFQTLGKFGNGLRIAKPAPGNSFLQGTGPYLDPRRGSISFWLQLQSATLTGTPEIFDIFPGPPRILASLATTRDSLVFTVLGYTVSSGPLTPLAIGTWYHIAWTWWGMEHKVYVNGTLGQATTIGTPMVPTQAASFRVGPAGGGTQDIVLDELTIYNVTLTPAEVTTLATAVTPGPLATFDTHSLLLDAQWAPGDRQVHVAVDVGNAHTVAAASATVTVKNAANTTVGSGVITPLLRGFGEGVFAISPMGPDTYHVEVVARDVSNATLATASSPPFVVPSTPWLGNTLALTDVVQPPWTPMTRTGQTVQVIGRTMELGNGIGLPQQMTSQGKTLLAAPVSVDIVQGGSVLPITGRSTVTVGGGGSVTMIAAPALPRTMLAQSVGPSITFTSEASHLVQWSGSGTAGPVQLAVQGSVEYDGMMLFTVEMSPTAGPVVIDRIDLTLAMPAARAPFMHTTTDQRYWWYPYKAATAATPGVFHTNLMQQAGKSTFLPFVLFSDHDVGLEWFADNPSGWVVNEAQVMQTMSRDAGNIITLQNHIANIPFTLTAPRRFTFGLQATPVKPLPSDWRTLSVHFNPLPLTSTLHLWWVWPTDQGGACCRQGQFNLYPVDMAGWNAAWAAKRAAGLKIAPFTNAHVELPHGADTWESLNAILYDETQNDGWIGQPTRGYRDYWIYQLNQWFAGGGLDAIYIDESYGFGVTQFLLAGGYIKEDGTHGYGYTNMGVRKLLQRVRQLFLDHGLRPLVWIHNTSTQTPHAFAFTDMMSDGEGYMFETPTDPDWVDTWGNRLLDPSVGDSTDGGPWLLSISRAQKYGTIPVFLNYIKFFSLPTEYAAAMRQYHGLTGLLDIIPIDSRINTTTNAAPLLAAKEALGIGAADVTWQPYWTQTAVLPSRADIKASYWQRTASTLALVMNLGEAFTGAVTVNLAGLGLTGGTVKDGETNAPYTVTGGQITMTIPRHDYRLLRFDAP